MCNGPKWWGNVPQAPSFRHFVEREKPIIDKLLAMTMEYVHKIDEDVIQTQVAF